MATFKQNQLVLLDESDALPFSTQKCNAKHVKAFVREQEYPVMVVGGAIMMTIEGDRCAQVPKFVRYFSPIAQLPPYGDGGLRTALAAKPSYQRPPDRDVLTQVYAPDVQRMFLTAALAVTAKRCGAVPNQIQFVARMVEGLDGDIDYRARSGKIKRIPFKSEDLYSGRVYPHQSLYTLVNDDPEQEKAFRREEGRRLNAAERKAEERAVRQAAGAALGALILGAADNTCEWGKGCPEIPGVNKSGSRK